MRIPRSEGMTFQINTLFGKRADESHINSVAVLDRARSQRRFHGSCVRVGLNRYGAGHMPFVGLDPVD